MCDIWIKQVILGSSGNENEKMYAEINNRLVKLNKTDHLHFFTILFVDR